VLWDVFGELKDAYALATAAFVGGSLKPLGGQNFLEALVCGVPPVIGPFWEHLQWVGLSVVQQGLVRVAPDWRQAARLLESDLAAPSPRKTIRTAALAYIRRQRGGSRVACRLIRHYLDQAPWDGPVR
jgi:3-deoxy-D-manno-octulosonic-acid transferase